MSREERAVHRYPGGGSEDIRITKSLSNWLSVSRLPDSLVDGGAFLEFVYKLNPDIKYLQDRTFLQNIYNMQL